MCRGDHIEACNWDYGKWTDGAQGVEGRKRYLTKAQNLLGIVDYETAKKIIAAL